MFAVGQRFEFANIQSTLPLKESRNYYIADLIRHGESHEEILALFDFAPNDGVDFELYRDTFVRIRCDPKAHRRILIRFAENRKRLSE